MIECIETLLFLDQELIGFCLLSFSVWSYFTWTSCIGSVYWYYCQLSPPFYFHLKLNLLLHVLHFRTHDVMPFLIYRGKMRAEGLIYYPYILGMALNQYRIDTEDHYLH